MENIERKGVKRTQRDYNMAFKLAVISQVEKGELTYKQAQGNEFISYLLFVWGKSPIYLSAVNQSS
ncbi:hypothetical protein NBRC110019_22170 [Neptunitalea chrysea]|uniref:Transposase n=1 Tax=Neptunitalea chrysea TaxID=1647581 RepID=A0A9W6B7D6_9FLAO|nr:hypothetical protein [Neptunitalea chrysea]GLB53177.1 hypothetical protein NBRC110019_22170 [Neptunitalea chrysea]